jgi:hypothetical protein
MIKVTKYDVIHFPEVVVNKETGETGSREVILMYALGMDGIVYEMSGGKWFPLPIDESNMRKIDKEKVNSI